MNSVVLLKKWNCLRTSVNFNLYKIQRESEACPHTEDTEDFRVLASFKVLFCVPGERRTAQVSSGHLYVVQVMQKM